MKRKSNNKTCLQILLLYTSIFELTVVSFTLENSFILRFSKTVLSEINKNKTQYCFL